MPAWAPERPEPGAVRAPSGQRAAGGPDTPAYAAPARVADPAGLPPAYIEVTQLGMFRDEDLAYALRLGQASVPVEFHLHPGAPSPTAFFRAPDAPVPHRWLPCSQP